MDGYILNIDRSDLDEEKRNFLKEFDEILEKNRLDKSKELDQIRNLDVKDLFKCFTI